MPAAGPYTPAVRAGDWLVVSGQVGLGPDGLGEGFAGQLHQALANLDSLLAQHGATADQVVKTTVFLVDMARLRRAQHDLLRVLRPPPSRPLRRGRGRPSPGRGGGAGGLGLAWGRLIR